MKTELFSQSSQLVWLAFSEGSSSWGPETSVYCLSASCWDIVQNKAYKTNDKFLCWTAVYSLDEVKRGKRKMLCVREYFVGVIK